MTYGPNLGQHLCLWIDFYYTIHFVYHWEFFLGTISVLSTSERDSVTCKAKAIIGLWQRKHTDVHIVLQYNKKQTSKLWNILPIGNSVKKKAGQDPKDKV